MAVLLPNSDWKSKPWVPTFAVSLQFDEKWWLDLNLCLFSWIHR